MGKTKKLGPAARFGSRYGFSIKKKLREIEVIQRRRHRCPQCGKKAVKRESNAIWKCRSCGAVFTGGAYYPETELGAMVKRIVCGER